MGECFQSKHPLLSRALSPRSSAAIPAPPIGDTSDDLLPFQTVKKNIANPEATIHSFGLFMPLAKSTKTQRPLSKRLKVASKRSGLRYSVGRNGFGIGRNHFR